MLQHQDIVFIATAGVTSWSRFINQVLPFTDLINSTNSADNSGILEKIRY